MRVPWRRAPDAINAFWRWFIKNEETLFHFEADQEAIFDRLHNELRKINSDLVFEFSSIVNGKREFTVSAGGIRDAFPTVAAVVRAAPPLSRWQVIPFRQRLDPPLGIQLGGERIGPEDMRFTAQQREGLDIYIYMKGVEQASESKLAALKQCMYLMLDQVLGEFDVEMKIHGIALKDISTAPNSALPIIDLRSLVDNLKIEVPN